MIEQIRGKERRGHDIQHRCAVEIVERQCEHLQQDLAQGFLHQRSTGRRDKRDAISIKNTRQESPIGVQCAGHYANIVKLIPVRLDQIQNLPAGRRQLLFRADDTVHCYRHRLIGGWLVRIRQSRDHVGVCRTGLNTTIKEAPGKSPPLSRFNGKQQRRGNGGTHSLKQRQLHLGQIVESIIECVPQRG